jgi:hypothetical protein
MYGGVWRGLLAPVTAAVSSVAPSAMARVPTVGPPRFLIFAYRNEMQAAHVPDRHPLAFPSP